MKNEKPIPPSEAAVRVRSQLGQQRKLEDLLAGQLKALGVLCPEREYIFASPRRWRFDFAWPDLKLAVEVDGGTWSGGRHVRGSGYAKDCQKGNAALLRGWRVLHYTSEMVRSGLAAREVAGLLKGVTA
jgi:hypothetical protein